MWSHRQGFRPGFRMFEIHDFYFEYIAPWWELAINEPEKRFPKTFALIATIEDEGDRELKRKQIIAGIAAGHDELVKMSSKLLSAPVVFLLLRDPVRGPSLLRAVLSVLALNDFPLGEGWGVHVYPPPLKRPAEEQVLVDLLMVDQSSVVHWFQQLGFNRPVVRSEMQALSKPPSNLSQSEAASTQCA